MKRILFLMFGLLLLTNVANAANSLNTNPIFLDTTGDTSAITRELPIVGIVVIPNNTSWSCIIHDASGGDVVFRAGSAANEPFAVTFAKPIPASGLFFTTGTNIAAVLLYLGN